MNFVTTREMRRKLERDNAKLPAVLTPLAREEWPASSASNRKLFAVWRSCRYVVQAYEEAGQVVRLSISRSVMRADGRWEDGLTWDELQQIKRQVGYGDYFAIEIYPRDRDVVNVANMRHLWVMQQPLDIGWRK